MVLLKAAVLAHAGDFAHLWIARVQGLKGASEDDMEAVLDRVMMLFRYLQEKDVFEKYYKQHLAKRLLSGRTARPQPPQRSCLPAS